MADNGHYPNSGPEINRRLTVDWWQMAKKFGASHWVVHAIHTIKSVHDGMSADATLADRMRAVDEAYPFGPRDMHPYKQWLKVRKFYLAAYGYERKGKAKVGTPKLELGGKVYESPLEHAKRRGGKQ